MGVDLKDLTKIRLHRNYCHDEPGMIRDIHITICECFDELQTDRDVSMIDMIKCIMKKSRGAWNPMIVNQELLRFKK